MEKGGFQKAHSTALKQALLYANQYKNIDELSGQLVIYGNAYDDFLSYEQLELIYLRPE